MPWMMPGLTGSATAAATGTAMANGARAPKNWITTPTTS
jgi:hypothetical protein